MVDAVNGVGASPADLVAIGSAARGRLASCRNHRDRPDGDASEMNMSGIIEARARQRKTRR